MLRSVLNASRTLAGLARTLSSRSLSSSVPSIASTPRPVFSPRLIPLLGPSPRVPKIPTLNDPPPAFQSLIIIDDVNNRRTVDVTTPPTTTPANYRTAIQDPRRIIEQQAARLIVIRRRKMRRHKLKKLRKKMKFVWLKHRQRRELKKEKLFQGEILAQLKTAEKFDAVAYVADKIKRVNEVPTPKLWKGKRLPEFVILDLLKKREEKLKKLSRDAERRKSMKILVSEYKV